MELGAERHSCEAASMCGLLPISVRSRCTLLLEVRDYCDLQSSADTSRPAVLDVLCSARQVNLDSLPWLSGVTQSSRSHRPSRCGPSAISTSPGDSQVFGGGYSRPIDASVTSHADVFRSAALRLAAL